MRAGATSNLPSGNAITADARRGTGSDERPLGESRARGKALTTECNAEPYLKWLDGYLTWHWQHDGQVPAFPAVYGGAIQMFGRAYRGGPTRDLALRMKAGQQLVFGEQIGWIDPGVAREEENAAFLRQVARLRWHARRYFYAGEMARPPRLLEPVARVEADWRWSGEWPVTTDAVLAGAWRLPREGRALLLFANVSDAPARTRVRIEPEEYGIAAERITLRRITAEGAGKEVAVESGAEREISLDRREAWGWELEPAAAGGAPAGS